METRKSAGNPEVGDESLEGLERAAVHFVRLAGALILSSRESPGEVQFKGSPKGPPNASPASDVDRSVEILVRDEIHRLYPEHGIIGEEQSEVPEHRHEYIWVIDPLDGTSNFLNGFPLFASTVGVVRDGHPVVAATWCITTHAGVPGVFHAHVGSGLCFDGAPLPRKPRANWRGLVGEPGWRPQYGRYWDTRVLGSAASELALVAAGVVRVSVLERPRIWDVAGGLLLALEGGCVAYVQAADGWQRFQKFEAADAHELRSWRARLLVGAEDELIGTVLAPHAEE